MKALLIMPKFFDYPQEISKELVRMGYEVDFFDDRPSTNGIVKAIIRVKKDIINTYIKSYFNEIMKTIKMKQYDIVFFISGQSLSFSKDMISEIKASQPKAKFVLYQWDSLENFPDIKNIYQFFDKSYSFDRNDVLANENLKFLPLFFTNRYEEIARLQPKEYEYDFSFVGTAHPKKYKYIKRMSEELNTMYSKQFIYFFFPSRIVYFYRKLCNPELKNARYSEFKYKPLNSTQIDNIITNSKCILDSAQDGQMGLTIRVLETLGSKKKLITTNEDVVNYDFYKEENIYVYKGEFDYSSKFFLEEYSPIPDEIYSKYSLNNWLKEILS